MKSGQKTRSRRQPDTDAVRALFEALDSEPGQLIPHSELRTPHLPLPLTTNHRPLTTTTRDPRGRFLPGCPPGPGRPRKTSGGHFIPEGQLYMEIMEQDRAVAAWQSIIRRNGADAAAALLKDLEAAHGPIRYRQAALDAIAAARRDPPPAPAAHKRKPK